MKNLLLAALMVSFINSNVYAQALHSTEEVVLENDYVKVTRVIIPPGVTHTSSVKRMHRVIVWLRSAEKERTEMSDNRTARLQPEVLVRKPGDVGWRNASAQNIKNNSDTTMESLIIELKN